MAFPALKISHRVYFTVLFLLFGAIIALFTSIINYNLDVRNIRKELDTKAADELAGKRIELSVFTERLEGYVASLRNSPLLHAYIRRPDPEHREIVNQLFSAISASNPSLMQVRFIDTRGMEKIRIDRNPGEQWPEIVPETNLQDKSHRYYFIEASQIPANSFWYSRLDLNVEHQKIEIPFKPVLRVASPVYVDQQFAGIVIINVQAKSFLQRFGQSPFFNIALIDHDGYYLLHYQDQFSWSRYLNTGRTVADDFPGQVLSILRDNPSGDVIPVGNFYVGSLDPLLKKDRAHLLFIPRDQAVQVMKRERRQAMVLIVGTILLLSVPLSVLISRIPARLNQKIDRQKATLQKYVDLIDRNILIATTDPAGIITEVSTAFCRVSGFSKEELIGRKPRILHHPDMRKDVKQEVRQTIQAGRTWVGEFHNRTKDGDSYWVEATIFPNYDEQHNIDGYTAIYQDTTDKKRIELLSVTDALTGLYNRRFFNETLEKELGRATRDNKMLGFAMVDVDFFKQYNDHYGHQKGDEVLKAISQTLQQKMSRSSDFCFRLGGEEFGIIFSDLSPDQALDFAETIRSAIEALAIEHRWGCSCSVVTASFGLLCITPGPGITIDTIYQKADQALYAAKQEGRNRIFFDRFNCPAQTSPERKSE